MREKILGDTILSGLIIGTISIVVDYVILFYTDKMLFTVTDMGHILKSPRLPAIILAMNIILFRFMIVKWKKAETGKGILLAILIATVLYIYKYKNSV